MATNPRSAMSDRTNLTLVRGERPQKRKTPRSMIGKLVGALVALALLGVVLRYLAPGSKDVQAQAANPNNPTILATPEDLQLGNVQMSTAPGGQALYLDGTITNTGKDSIAGATVEVNFQDAQGKPVGSVREPIAGMSHGGTDLNGSEFARNPIEPNQMRFFRIAVEQIPPGWNHQLPDLRVIALDVQ
jgi:hypothetical protein